MNDEQLKGAAATAGFSRAAIAGYKGELRKFASQIAANERAAERIAARGTE